MSISKQVLAERKGATNTIWNDAAKRRLHLLQGDECIFFRVFSCKRKNKQGISKHEPPIDKRGRAWVAGRARPIAILCSMNPCIY